MRFRVYYRMLNRRAIHKAAIAAEWAAHCGARYDIHVLEFSAPTIVQGVRDLQSLIDPSDPRLICGRTNLREFVVAEPA